MGNSIDRFLLNREEEEENSIDKFLMQSASAPTNAPITPNVVNPPRGNGGLDPKFNPLQHIRTDVNPIMDAANKGFAKGLVDLPAMIAGNVVPNRIDALLDKGSSFLDVNPNAGLVEKGTYYGAYLAGSLVTGGPLFKGASKLVQLGSKLLPGSIAARATGAIAQTAAKSADLAGRVGLSPKVAGVIGESIKVAPNEFAAGGLLTAAATPEIFRNPEQLGIVGGLTVLSSVVGGYLRARALAKTISEAKTPEAVEALVEEVKEVSISASRIRALVDGDEIPTSLETALRRMQVAAFEAEVAAKNRALQLAESSRAPDNIIQGPAKPDPLLKIKQAQDAKRKRALTIYKNKRANGEEVPKDVLATLDLLPKPVVGRNPVTGGDFRKANQAQLDMPDGVSRPQGFSIDELDEHLRKSNDDMNRMLQLYYTVGALKRGELLDDIVNRMMSAGRLIDEKMAKRMQPLAGTFDPAAHAGLPASDIPKLRNLENEVRKLAKATKIRFDATGQKVEKPKKGLVYDAEGRVIGGDKVTTAPPSVTARIETMPETAKPVTINPLNTDAERKILSNIGDSGNKRRWSLRSAFTRFRTEVSRGILPLEQADRALTDPAKLNANNASGAAAQLSNGIAGKVEQFLDNQPFLIDPDGNIKWTNTPAYKQILATVENDLDAYRAATIAAHVLDSGVQAKKVKVGDITVEDAQQVWENAAPHVKKAVEAAANYRKIVLQYATDAGLVNEASAAKWMEIYENYVSLERVFESEGSAIFPRIVNAIKERTPLGTGRQYHELLGSTRKIRDPISTTIEQTRLLIRAADRNKIGVNLAHKIDANPELAEQLGIGVRIGPATKMDSAHLYAKRDNLLKAATEAGVDLDETTALELAAKFSSPLDANSNTLHVWQNGALVKYRVSPDIARAYKSLAPADYDLIWQALGLPAHMLKRGVTLNPVFVAFNAVRDSWEASMNSKYGFRLGVDSVKGFVESVKNGRYRQEFLAGGGAFGGITTTEATTSSRAARSVLPRSKSQRVKDKIFHPIEALESLARPFEEAARLGEFMRARNAGASVLEAALAGRNVTTDFNIRGSATAIRAMSMMAAFMNPAIQSIERNAITIAQKGVGPVMIKGIAGISIPSMLMWAAYKDDQEINDLRKTDQGYRYWFYRTPDNEIGRIPKPYLWGQIFGTMVEASLDKWATDDPHAAEWFVRGITKESMIGIIPTGVRLGIEAMANKNLHYGTPIVGLGQEMVEDAFQQYESTSSVSKAIAEGIYNTTGASISPIMMDHVVKSMTGGLGRHALEGGSEILNSQADNPPGRADAKFEMFVAGDFFADPNSKNVAPLREMYKHYDETATKLNTVKKMFASDPERAQSYLREHAVDIQLAPMYAEAKEQIDNLQQMINQINNNKFASREEKKRYRDYFVNQMTEIARTINTTAHETKTELEAGLSEGQ